MTTTLPGGPRDVTAALHYLVAEGAHASRVSQAREALRWAATQFGDKFTVATSMGDLVLPDLVATTVPEVDLFFIDTGYHFAETLATRDRYAAEHPVRVRTLLPLTTVAEQDAELGPRLHDRDPDECCARRKVEPLSRALTGFEAWGSGVRRGETEARRDVEVIDWDERRGMVKVNPLAYWTDDDVARYVEDHGVPRNPLTGRGYGSIGCAPCTRPLRPGESPRDGRWSGRDKTECGLHI